MSTPNSTLTSYCTPDQFATRYDLRTVGELLTDSDVDPPITPSQVLISTDLNALLLASSAEVEMAAQLGNKYTQTDLAVIAGLIPPPGQLSPVFTASTELLADLVADLTIGRLFKRRPLRDPGLDPPTAVKDAREMLQAIRDGERVFGLIEHSQAGVTNSIVEVVSDVIDRDGLTFQAERFYGRRTWRDWH